MARKSDKTKLIFLMLYFLILTVERVISLAAVFTGDFSGYDFLEWYMTGLTIFAIIGAYFFIFTRITPMERQRRIWRLTTAFSGNFPSPPEYSCLAEWYIPRGLYHPYSSPPTE